MAGCNKKKFKDLAGPGPLARRGPRRSGTSTEPLSVGSLFFFFCFLVFFFFPLVGCFAVLIKVGIERCRGLGDSEPKGFQREECKALGAFVIPLGQEVAAMRKRAPLMPQPCVFVVQLMQE